MGEVDAIVACCQQILQSLDQLDSKYASINIDNEELKKIAIIASTNPKVAEELVKAKGEDFAGEFMAIKKEYERIKKEMKGFGLRLPETRNYKYLGIKGLIFQIRIGCTQAMAFLSKLEGDEQPKAKLI